MALNSDLAFKFGCGRYIQERNAIVNNLETELNRFGKKILFICGENGYRIASDKIKEALKEYKLCYFSKEQFGNIYQRSSKSQPL